MDILFVMVLGAVIGSFLNVVIYRGPAQWGLIELSNAEPAPSARGSIVRPRSYCPDCRRTLTAIDLIPILSFALLGGKCRYCAAPISGRYPIVELLAGAGTTVAYLTINSLLGALAMAVMLWSLIALAFIDWDTGYLPDALTLPLIAGGLGVNAVGLITPAIHSILGGIIGYGVFWVVAEGFRRLRGKEGLGGGDAKLLAAIGAWGGWTVLAPTVFLASMMTLLFVAASSLRKKTIDASTEIPFGPGLAAAGAGVIWATAARTPWAEQMFLLL